LYHIYDKSRAFTFGYTGYHTFDYRYILSQAGEPWKIIWCCSTPTAITDVKLDPTAAELASNLTQHLTGALEQYDRLASTLI
jgi:hypothetical protein